ncbi:hypothetical protein ADUPG1_012835 [Aduncisulcus paluster]|uniref:Uncharacterized protein n=1 Tax=Aduncisulcus paluster TaxID=2918883 RepID=A0ABQ5K0U4_9EUKA|nr:hypothetical protein ADUPG1_012835 [Aduncisulcus paluster]
MKKSQDKEKTKRPAVPLEGWERSMLPHEWRVDSEGREQLPMGFKLQPNSFVVVIPKTPPTKGSLAPAMLGPYQVVSHDQVFKRVQLRNLVNDEVKTWSDDSVVPFDDSLYNDDQLKKLCAVGKDEYIIEKVISHYKGLNAQDEEEYLFEVKWLTWAETFVEPGSGLAHNLTFKQFLPRTRGFPYLFTGTSRAIVLQNAVRDVYRDNDTDTEHRLSSREVAGAGEGGAVTVTHHPTSKGDHGHP